MKKRWVVFLLLMICLIPMKGYAKYDLDYQEIHKEVYVTRDSEVIVTETGQVSTDSKVTVVRALPFYFDTVFQNKRLAEIRDVQGSATSFRYSNLGSTMYLKAVVNQNHPSYRISYIYDFSSIEGIGNQLYLPLLKKEEYHSVKQFTFKITFESLSTFEQFQWLLDQKIVDYDQIDFHVSNGTIEGTYQGELKQQDLTLMQQLPSDYFYQNHNHYHNNAILFFLFTGCMLIIVFILYFMAKRKVKTPPIVKTPPAKLSPAEIGYIYKGEVSDKDIFSYLVLFATKNLIKIEEDDKTKSLKLIKQKELESADEIENTIFQQLFSTSTSVSVNSFKGKYYKKLNKLREKLSKRTLEDQVYDKKSYSLLYLIYGLTLFAFLSLELCFCFSVIGILSDSMICVLFTFFVILCLLFTINHQVPYLKQLSYGIIFIFLFMMSAYSFTDFRYNWFYIVCIIMMLMMLALGKEIQKQFKGHSYIVRRIEGFRRFLKEEKAKSQEQFYQYLPYAYVLGVSKNWFRHNQNNQFSSPSWMNEVSFATFSKLFEYYMETIGMVFSAPDEEIHPQRERKVVSIKKGRKNKNFEEETKIADAANKK